MQGCSYAEGVRVCWSWVIPAYAGLFPFHFHHYRDHQVIPAYAGLFQQTIGIMFSLKELSLRMQGCSSKTNVTEVKEKVIPAYAGLFHFRRAG